MIRLPASQLLPLLRREEISSAELTQAYLAAIHRHDGQIAAFLHVDDERAMAQAHAADDKRRRGDKPGSLAGLPAGHQGRALHRQASRPPAAARSCATSSRLTMPTSSSRLRQADAVFLGKTNMDEFAMGSSTENSAYQVTRNPWNLERIPGGSSGGSAAAVAACWRRWRSEPTPAAPFASLQPCAASSASSPVYGRVSRFGLIAYGSSLDQVGPFAHDVAGRRPAAGSASPGTIARDSTSVDSRRAPPTADPRAADPAADHRRRPRVSSHEGLDAEVEQAVRAALKVYEKLGATVEEISLPHSPYAVAAYYLVATAEASSNLARYDGVHFGHRAASVRRPARHVLPASRGEGFRPEVKRRIMLGTHVLSSGLHRRLLPQGPAQVRRLIKNDFDQAFARCDVILGPTSPTPAFKIGDRSTIRWRCICPTSTRSAQPRAASPASAFRAVSRRQGCRSACRFWRRRLRRRKCWHRARCSNEKRSGISSGRNLSN